VEDRSEARRHLAELAEREAAEVAAARAALATDGTIRLSDIGRLDSAPFRLFLGLLGDALGALGPGRREISTTATDGSLAVTLTVLDHAPQVRLDTNHGVFRGPDHLVRITDLTAPAQVERSA